MMFVTQRDGRKRQDLQRCLRQTGLKLTALKGVVRAQHIATDERGRRKLVINPNVTAGLHQSHHKPAAVVTLYLTPLWLLYIDVFTSKGKKNT